MHRATTQALIGTVGEPTAIEGFENLHDLLAMLHVLLLGVGCLSTPKTPRRSAERVDALRQRSGSYADLVAASAQFSCPPTRGFMTVYAQDLMAADSGLGRYMRAADAWPGLQVPRTQ